MRVLKALLFTFLFIVPSLLVNTWAASPEDKSSAPFTIQDVIDACPLLAKWEQDPESPHNLSRAKDKRIFEKNGKKYYIQFAMFSGDSSKENFEKHLKKLNLENQEARLNSAHLAARYSWNNHGSSTGPWYNISFSEMVGDNSKINEVTLQDIFKAFPTLANFTGEGQIWLAPGEDQITFEMKDKMYLVRLASYFPEANDPANFGQYVKSIDNKMLPVKIVKMHGNDALFLWMVPNAQSKIKTIIVMQEITK